jgi:hypothetical protein
LWLQWKKTDGERVEQETIISQQVSKDSHPDDFRVGDFSMVPVFKAEAAPVGDDAVQWMQPASLADSSSEYKKRYAAARKKKLVGKGGTTNDSL